MTDITEKKREDAPPVAHIIARDIANFGCLMCGLGYAILMYLVGELAHMVVELASRQKELKCSVEQLRSLVLSLAQHPPEGEEQMSYI